MTAAINRLEPAIMTEEKARYYAEALAQSMGITFYVVRSREGEFLPVQLPSGNCEVLATVTPPGEAKEPAPSQ